MLKYKISVLGPPCVGKTSLLNQFCGRFFDKTYDRTIEDSRYAPITETETVEFLDTGDPDLYKQKEWFTGYKGWIYVYDISSRSTFYLVLGLLDHAQEIFRDQSLSKPDGPVALVGNMTDLGARREVSETEGRQLAALYGASFFETSAKNNTGVKELFEHQLKQMIVVQDAAPLVDPEPGTTFPNLRNVLETPLDSSICNKSCGSVVEKRDSDMGKSRVRYMAFLRLFRGISLFFTCGNRKK